MTSVSTASHEPVAARGSWPIALTILAWLGVIAFGAGTMLFYENSPGQSAAAPSTWPSDCGLAASHDRPTLLFFAHPRCPCTESSLAELARVLSDVPDVDATVAFFEPEGAGPEWRKTSLWNHARATQHLTAIPDPGGTLARKFGVRTSGEVLVYRPDGPLAFEGGITAGRGVAAAGEGESALERVLRNEQKWARGGPVYGCQLDGPSSQCSVETEHR